MAADEDAVDVEVPDTSVSDPYELRITNHGKIRHWVEFALDFFQKYPDRPLTLHTLPAIQKTSSNDKDAAQINEPGDTAPAAQEQRPESATTTEKKSRMHTTMSTIPRLVSVVEIIKREYLKTLDADLSEAGKLSGLHQYNNIGELEQALEISEATAEEDRQKALALALQGKRHLRQQKVAYMKVTLCRKELPQLLTEGVTYQQPSVRALSKSARVRLKKRLKKAERTE